MQQGESRTVPVEAAEHWNHTGIGVEPGERLRLSAAGTWCDRGEEWGPAGHPGRRLVYRLAGLLRRRRDLPWFSLVGALDEDQHSTFAIGVGTEWTAPRAGELTGFANDVGFMYGNNSGHVDLTVERIG